MVQRSNINRRVPALKPDPLRTVERARRFMEREMAWNQPQDHERCALQLARGILALQGDFRRFATLCEQARGYLEKNRKAA